jgi:RHS repeat-associated protein
VSADYLHSSKFSQFARLVRGRNYIKNSSGVFAVVETDDTYANTELFHPPSHWYGKLSTTETWYIHADQLGSILRVTDQDGRVRERFWYTPWGARAISENNQPGPGEAQQIAGSWKRGFVGQEHLDEFSLIHLNGRMYNSSLGVFTSVDPINQTVSDPQSGNGYVYTRGNPLRYVDPSGYDFFSDVGNFVSGVVGGIGNALGAAWNGVSHFLGEAGKWLNENWRTVVIVAVVIVVEVVTVGAATPAVGVLAAGILGGMAAGAVGGALGAALYGGSPDDIIAAAIKGAVIGGIAGAASAGVTEYFGAAGTQTTTASEVESIAAHGAIAGGRQALEGGNFWAGLEAGLIVAAVDTYGPQNLGRTENVAKSSLIGGTTAAINGGKFANGAIMGAFSADFKNWVEGYSSIIGKIWALPNTALGLAVGVFEYGAGLITGNVPSLSFENNAIQILNAPIGFGGALTLGNVEIFNDAGPKTPGLRYGYELDYEFEGSLTSENSVQIGPHEEGHTYQYERLGPLFLPAYLLYGGISDSNPFEKSADNYGRNTGGPFSGFR